MSRGIKNKRILICCNRTLSIGGIEKALTTFLQAFNRQENEVWLVLSDNKGPLMCEIPKDNLNIIYTNTINSKELLVDDIRHFRVHEVVKGLWNRFRLRCEKNWYARIMYGYMIMQRKLIVPGKFDCAIAYSTDYSDLAMILAADAKKRVAYIHGDATQNLYAAKLNDSLLRRVDLIYSVSDGARKQFLKMHPACNGKVEIMHNILNVDEIRSKAEASVEDMICDGTMTLCTVGRVSREKGQQMILEIAEILLRNNKVFRWYVIGDGDLKPELVNEIEKRGLRQQIILLGAKQNPYPYMKNCDIYVQTSLAEAYCITLAEARILARPIVSTPFVGVEEQIVNGENGLLSESIDPVALANQILRLMESSQLRSVLSGMVRELKNENEIEMEKLYNYIWS